MTHRDRAKTSAGSLIPPPDRLIILAGAGEYPKLVAEGARAAGVKTITTFALRGHANAKRVAASDDIHWIHLGNYEHNLTQLASYQNQQIVMAGQISPVSLFTTRLDKRLKARIQALKTKNADTIYGAIIDDLTALGLKVLPASAFMKTHIPKTGILTERVPSSNEQRDIDLGINIATETSRLNIGQTVATKEGAVIAVEAFEGTNATIKRAGRVGRGGCVMVKVASDHHDMRFDIPGIGVKTIRLLKKHRFTAVALQAGRTLLFNMPRVIEAANQAGISMMAFESGLPHAPVCEPSPSQSR